MGSPGGCCARRQVHEATLCGQIAWLAIALAFLLASGFSASAQTGKAAQAPKAAPAPPDPFQQHYDAARTFQLGGDQEHAAAEYKLFLAEALRRIANTRANSGEYAAAAQFFEEALSFSPDNPDLYLDYATLRVREGKPQEARSLAEKLLATQPNNAKAHSMLGRILYQQGDYKGAKEHLEIAVVEAPSFDVGYLLGITYIRLNDLNRATLLFNEMMIGLGDTPQLHLYFARAYREGELYPQAIEELNKAIVRDPKTPQAHYFLGMAYLGRDNESGFPEAAVEFRRELENHPNDVRSHYMLGYIALKQRNLKEAEAELSRAVTLDPRNPDPFVYLAQLFLETDRLAEAEQAARKAIALTTDMSRNEYQVTRAHYILARVLLNTGRKEEAEKELAISEKLRKEPAEMAQRRLAGAPDLPQEEAAVAPPVAVLSPEELKQAEAYLDQLKPAIADSYNNLGVAAAGRKDFAVALDYFQKAAGWNPSLETVARNLGMAAFYANQYSQAIVPLERHLQGHPDDTRARAALGLSYFGLGNYARTRETMRPITAEVNADPGLSYAYAVSLVKTGEYDEGVDRLKSLQNSSVNSADLHVLLGDAYADQKIYATALQEYRAALALDPERARTHFQIGLTLIHQGNPSEAIPELRAALKLDPADIASKYHLAFALIQAQQKEEARSLLQEVIQQDPKHADAYYQLGKMQLEQGDAKAAISNLEAGSQLSPDSDYIHYQLALAYRRDSRAEDAEREMKLYQTLKDRRRPRGTAEPN